MEVPNSGADSQTSDQSQPIQEPDDQKMVGDPADASVGGELELGNGGGGADMVKKKRGRPPRAQAKSPPAKMIKEEDEDVCFICFDGGSLVLCDRRGCPKAYHPACVKRDEAFFRSKAKWNCGCTKNVDFVKNSTDLQGKWPDIPQEPISKDMIDVNSSTKADKQERETNASETSHDQAGGSGKHKEGERTEPTTTVSKAPSPELVVQFKTNHKEAGDGTVQPATVDAAGPPSSQPSQSLPQDPHQQTYGGERYIKVEDSGYGGNGNCGGGGSRAPPKGQRVCKFYKGGRCKKGASCNYWHP